MLQNFNLKKISMTVFAIAITAFFVVSCDKADELKQETPEITQKMITPQAIVCGDIDVEKLTKDQRINFWGTHESNPLAEHSEAESMEARYLTMFDFSAEDVHKALEIHYSHLGPGEQITEERMWETAFLTKEQYDNGFLNYLVLVGKGLSPEEATQETGINIAEFDFDENIKNVKQKALEKIEPQSSLKSVPSTCSCMHFPHRGVKANSYDASCSYVTYRMNSNDGDCDYTLCFNNAQSNYLYSDGIWMDLVLASFLGYDRILVRIEQTRTYVQLGATRTDGILYVRTFGNVEGYLKNNLKLQTSSHI